VLPLLDVATLNDPGATPFLSRGKLGVHSEHLGTCWPRCRACSERIPGALVTC
jgi:hypothetical protein